MTPLGSRPAFPQNPCQCVKVRADLGMTVVAAFPNCLVCHGTGLVGGGLTLREWTETHLLAAVVHGQLAAQDIRHETKGGNGVGLITEECEVDFARQSVRLARKLIAALEARESGHDSK